MTTVSTADLRENLLHIERSIPEPSWDFLVYCRFLAKRLPEKPSIDAGELGRMAEELVADLKEGVDRTNGQTFVPPLVSGRSDLLYNFIRDKLKVAAGKIGGTEFAAGLGLAAPPPPTPAAPAPAAAPPAAPPATAAAPPAAAPPPAAEQPAG
jgi:hypothetical protein